ncbi:MAG: hypothetical protein GX030_06165 [Firmicutes bacterium]|nr:hypothetical protein [Bacillota bacterium]
MGTLRARQESLNRKYRTGRIGAEEFIEALLRDNEFDQERRRIVKRARKIVGKKIPKHAGYSSSAMR